MAVIGDLATMPFLELLQWLGTNGKTGALEVERNRIRKRLVFKSGRIVATSSTDPREMLGHFLVSRGQITEELLRIALAQQENTAKPLGVTLVDMGVLTSDELVRIFSAQAEETLFSLFELEDAMFRFEHVETIDEAPFPVDIRVEDVLLRGMQRFDEVRRIREVFHSLGIVTERTDRLPPPEVFRNRVARRIYELIDGERTVADILLQAHGSEYVVTKFLYELHRTGLVRIREVRRIRITRPGSRPGGADGASRSDVAQVETARVPSSAPSGSETEPVRPASAPAVTAAAPTPAPAASAADAFRTDLESDLDRARTHMGAGAFAEALTILDRLYREHPDNDALRRLSQEAEVAFVEKAWKYYLPADQIVALTRSSEDLESEDLTPNEMFLLSRIDGSWTVKSIVQIAPIHEVDALRLLKRMRDRGIIELRDAG